MKFFLLLTIAALLCAQTLAATNGFSANLINSPALSLVNGAQSLSTVGGWSTGGNGFNLGNFGANGGYTIPVAGIYHFDANVLINVASATAPNQNVDIRIVNCAAGSGCNAYCAGGSVLGRTLTQGGSTWLGSGFNLAFPPNYNLKASYTGFFNVGDTIAVCIDNWAASGQVKLNCASSPLCTFAGFQIN
ncbi:hypothetical protein SAMD00019534_018620 [Acytostelium subglobosum LB1]|uniref:hypothetical protein n=1 Tax=Acytostelium subglobosum LB1 TaxID=1410327 RepID=UPI000644D4EA|nr:hypothetical protein SAMD00019534_018620 [Acytostelium subglobosum LB1]GAM18687.1 hypothetical protein SAMD00019534_018620 [Acytostelium subglobosum LB1]|eukprot:XP_012757907.1 hypothetical protein SAMD00019534_018620 [Acytostelium subglobosum LB1]